MCLHEKRQSLSAVQCFSLDTRHVPDVVYQDPVGRTRFEEMLGYMLCVCVYIYFILNIKYFFLIYND